MILSPTKAILNVLGNSHLPPKEFKIFALKMLTDTRPGRREVRLTGRCPVSGKKCEDYRNCHNKNHCWLK